MKRALTLFGINLALLVLVAAAAELIFGSLVLGTNYGLLVIDRNVDRTFDIAERYGRTAAGATTTRYTRDENGLRGDYGGDPATIDVLTIGGSTTNEILIDNDETWTARLGQILRAAGQDLTVVNAGVDGQSTYGHLKNFELWFPKIQGLKPAYVIAYIGINDTAYLQANHQPLKWDLMEERNRTIKQYLINNSALYGLYRTAKGMIRAREAMLVHAIPSDKDATWVAATPQPDAESVEADYPDHMQAFEDRVGELIRRIRALGAKAVIVTQVTGHVRIGEDGTVLGRLQPDGQVDINDYAKQMAHRFRAMKACKKAEAICIDLAGGLRFGEGDHYDFVHTTPRGSEKVARFVAKGFLPSLEK
ncbi:MAG: SGNH/GDSL hydrolase family protein [Rhodospirillales bacterium]